MTNYTHTERLTQADTHTDRQIAECVTQFVPGRHTNDRKSVGSRTQGRRTGSDCESDTKLFIHLDILHVRLRYILH